MKMLKMTTLILLMQLFLVRISWGAQDFQDDDKILELRPGDIILLSLNCSICPLIENETDSPYSHSGIVVQKDMGAVVVAQALGRGVQHVTLDQFLAGLRSGGVAHIYRARALDQLYHENPQGFHKFEDELWHNYTTQFMGSSFDPFFLWDNRDAQGKEKFYCSEFVAKLLNRSLERNHQIKPVAMDFSRNLSTWQRLFHGVVPQGKPGLAPADFTRNDLLYFVNSL